MDKTNKTETNKGNALPKKEKRRYAQKPLNQN